MLLLLFLLLQLQLMLLLLLLKLLLLLRRMVESANHRHQQLLLQCCAKVNTTPSNLHPPSFSHIQPTFCCGVLLGSASRVWTAVRARSL